EDEDRPDHGEIGQVGVAGSGVAGRCHMRTFRRNYRAGFGSVTNNRTARYALGQSLKMKRCHLVGEDRIEPFKLLN
ncbi:MAG: hypothetical protein LCH39_15180, partial [Proteobacteria bacterium]|nr:hypothetical protein [Pseudomonadota bacterium]